MYTIKFETRKYEFVDKATAEDFAKTWNEKVEYTSICGDPNCQCENLCKSFKYAAPLTLGQEGEDYQLSN